MILVRAIDVATDTRGRRARFRSGDRDLDRFFETRVDKNQGLYCATYVAVDGDEILGYVSVAATSVKREAVAAAEGPRSWPGLLLGRMAVSHSRKGQGIGSVLMEHVFRLALQQAELTACAVVIIDAKPGAETYYQRFGFEPLVQQEPRAAIDPMPMYLPIGTIRSALTAALKL
jgi:predicted N-acetyltransferase YhbS